MKYVLFTIPLFALLAGCQEDGLQADAYGNFEADELIVSAEANGQLLELP